MRNSHSKIKNIVRAGFCAFFALAIIVVNLPHVPIFQAQAQTSAQQVTNTDPDQCSLNIDFGTGDITQNYSKSCCPLLNTGGQKLRTDIDQIEKHIRNIALVFVLFALSTLTILTLTYLIDTRVESKVVSASRDSHLAQYAAEAGIQEVIIRLNSSPSSSSGANVFDENQATEGLMLSINDILQDGKNSSSVPDLFKFVDDKPKVSNANKRLDRVEKRLTKFLSTCTEQILCANQDKVFKQNILSPDNKLLPAVIKICLNRVGIALLGNSKAPCICTYKGCSCKLGAVCKSGKCSNDKSCNCSPEGECFCPLDKVCEKVSCISENNCICVDSLCNTDNDCDSGQACKTEIGSSSGSRSSGGTFTGVGDDLSSSSSTSSSSGTFGGVAGSLSSSGESTCGVICPAGTTLNTTTCSCEFNFIGSSSSGSGGTFSGVSGSIGSSSSGSCDETKLNCTSPKVANKDTCKCECPDVKCPAGTHLNPIVCICSTFKGVCLNPADEESRCGDGVVDENEECDDGASNSLSGPCLPTCQLADCGDGIFQPNLGEECDDGKHCEDGTQCSVDSTCIGIGNGVCTVRSGDGCSDDCQIETCTSNSDCESGFCVTNTKGPVCTKTAENDCPQDFETKICAPKFCKKNNQCGIIGVCRHGKCKPKPCRADNDCDGVDNNCDTQKGVCVSKPNKPEVCGKDDDCNSGTGEVCDDGTCATPCDQDDDCDSGKMCDTNKKLCVTPLKVKPGKCGDDRNCSKGETCDNGQCDTSCDQDDDCNSGICDTMVKVCIPKSKPGTCGKDEDCDGRSGEVCDNGKCTSTCGDGPCVIIPVSCLNVRCPSGLVCKDGKCVVECNSDNECKPPGVCKLGKCLLN